MSFRALALSVVLLAGFSLHATQQPSGDFIFYGKGSMLVTFDGVGNFKGIIAAPTLGLSSISGTALIDPSDLIVGTCVIADHITGIQIFSGPLFGKATINDHVLTLTINTPTPLKLTGQQRLGNEPSPAGQYFGTFLPTSLLVQCDRSLDRQLVTIQGDQDFGLDLTQAFGAQLLFNQKGDGFGVAFENSNPLAVPRYATAHYVARTDKLRLTLFDKPFGGTPRAATLTGVASSGKYDGVYNVNVTAAGCSTFTLKITVKSGVITGTSSNTGTVTGSVDSSGNLNFVTQNLIIPAPCPLAGTYPSATFTGAALNSPVFPQIIGGVFSTAAVNGTFVVLQPTGITGATTPGSVSKLESWTGTLTGTHPSQFCPGGIFGESFTLSLNFQSSLIAALRKNPALLAGNGSMSGSETILTQAPFATSICGLVANTLSGASVNVTFAGVLDTNQTSIEYSSPTVLIQNEVMEHTGPNTGTNQFENRNIIKLRVTKFTPTTVVGVWLDGNFALRKQ